MNKTPGFSGETQPPNTLQLYLSRQASGLGRYVLEQAVLGLCGWVPSVVGIALRAVAYRLIMRIQGTVAIENGVRIRFADQIRLAPGVYLDQGVYLHACPAGIQIGEGTYVMHHAELHVYNFRDLPHAGITVGRQSLIGEFCVIRGPEFRAYPRPVSVRPPLRPCGQQPTFLLCLRVPFRLGTFPKTHGVDQ